MTVNKADPTTSNWKYNLWVLSTRHALSVYITVTTRSLFIIFWRDLDDDKEKVIKVCRRAFVLSYVRVWFLSHVLWLDDGYTVCHRHRRMTQKLKELPIWNIHDPRNKAFQHYTSTAKMYWWIRSLIRTSSSTAQDIHSLSVRSRKMERLIEQLTLSGTIGCKLPSSSLDGWVSNAIGATTPLVGRTTYT